MTLGSVNMEADDPAALAHFWAEAIGGTISDSHEEHVYVAPHGPDGFAMFFQPRTGPRPDRESHHLDLTVPWGTRAAEVVRLLALGATHRWDVLDEVPWVRWTTLADPEGNLFCLAEHPPQG